MLGIDLTPREYMMRCADVCGLINETDIHRLSDDMFAAYQHRRAIFLLGNGGSGSNSTHMAQDFGKSTVSDDELDDDSFPRLRTISLSDNMAYVLAWANDLAFERVFVEQLRNLASPGDVVIAMSGSGNSANVLLAVEWANRNGLTTWGLTGYQGGELQSLARHNLHVPVDDMGLVESIHLVLLHWILHDLYARIHTVGRHVNAVGSQAGEADIPTAER